MKKICVLVTCFLLFFLVSVSYDKEALADTNKYSTNINLSNQNKQASFKFTMPKNGKIKLNIQVKDRDTVPGNLTFIIQKEFSINSERIEEITGITSTNGVNDLIMDLNQGEYYFRYELSNATGNFTGTVLGVNCQTEVLATLPNNIPELSIHNMKSFDDITKEDYDKINFGDDGQQKDVVLPFTVQKSGGILISLKQTEQSGAHGKLEACVYKDKECTKAIGKRFVLNETDDLKNISRIISEKGTYYVKFTYEYEGANGLTAFPVKLYYISGEDRTLTNGKVTAAYQISDNDKIIYKVDIKTTKLLKFLMMPLGNEKEVSTNFRLLDKNKKQLSRKSFVVSGQNQEDTLNAKCYTVKKGTYYLEVNSSCSIYQLRSQFQNVRSRSGTSKSNARLLKIRGKSAAGFTTISDNASKADWYKFKVTSSRQYVNCTFIYLLDGKISFEFLDSKGKVLRRCNKELTEGAYVNQIHANFLKGLYYIRIYKDRKASSFSYSLSLNKKR